MVRLDPLAPIPIPFPVETGEGSTSPLPCTSVRGRARVGASRRIRHHLLHLHAPPRSRRGESGLAGGL